MRQPMKYCVASFSVFSADNAQAVASACKFPRIENRCPSHSGGNRAVPWRANFADFVEVIQRLFALEPLDLLRLVSLTFRSFPLQLGWILRP